MKTKKIAFAAALPLGAAVLTREMYRFIFCRNGSLLLNSFMSGKSHKPDYYEHRDGTAEALRQRRQQLYTLRSVRGETLQGYYFPCGGEGKRIAFLIHGYRSEHAETAGMYLDYYESRGFDLFCCDHVSHGRSEGKYIGFDVFESEDCLLWLDFLRKEFGEEVQIVLHGFSMGAATVLCMSDRCPENVKFIVADSGYMDARVQLKGQLGALYYPLRLINWRVAGYDLARSDTRPHLRAAKLPILFVHGQEDRTVPFENGPRLVNFYQGERDCLFVPHARHVETMHVAPEAYAEKLDGFIRRYINDLSS